MSEMMTTLGQALGELEIVLRARCDAGERRGTAKRAAPRPTQKIGSESGSSFSTIGSQAVSSTTAPNPATTTM